ncbi:NAD(P)-dependent alcohol dehydrogenase [Sandaracinus amylolyticus]|uniref:Zinc-containing alcohol dehydrogenase n=1 Tax=Sandaracinus amylolyticus TaxID=927083 RepID=A0A0F6W0R7_9BACT|nr:NAD(P)-dependent alcohol dehydrogenase [Sandaracinus amylolyticus]AKF04498.1 zinc-containing alcohol dehydrogenase [Sandaracinus amylolyticus]
MRDEYGTPDVIALREIERPAPGDDEVLIRVRASSVNPADWILLTGRPYPVRLVAGLFRPKKRVLGMDVTGEVEAVGKNVTRFRPGDEVFGEVGSAYAEHVCAHQDRIAIKPKALSFEEAAAVPVAAMTALQGLRDAARVRAGHAVLINGASGGVGTFAVQIAKSLGAEVTGVCSGRNAEMVRSIGADHVVDYAREDFTRTAARYDAILDLVGSRSISDCRRALRPTGTYVSSVGRLGWSLKALFASVGSSGRARVLTSSPNAADLDVLRSSIDERTIAPVIDQRYPLSDVAEALRRQGEGHARGKSVVTV